MIWIHLGASLQTHTQFSAPCKPVLHTQLIGYSVVQHMWCWCFLWLPAPRQRPYKYQHQRCSKIKMFDLMNSPMYMIYVKSGCKYQTSGGSFIGPRAPWSSNISQARPLHRFSEILTGKKVLLFCVIGFPTAGDESSDLWFIACVSCCHLCEQNPVQQLPYTTEISSKSHKPPCSIL